MALFLELELPAKKKKKKCELGVVEEAWQGLEIRAISDLP